MNTNTTTYNIPSPSDLTVTIMERVVLDIIRAGEPCSQDFEDYCDYMGEHTHYWDVYGCYTRETAQALVDYGMTCDEVRSLGERAIELVEWAWANEARIQAVADCGAVL